jgi:hypothetical protein
MSTDLIPAHSNGQGEILPSTISVDGLLQALIDRTPGQEIY